MFDYPSEYLVQVEVPENAHTIIEGQFVTAISFITTKRKYGPYGKISESYNWTRLPTSPKRIVDFSCLSDLNFDVIVVQDVVRCLQHFVS